MEDCCAVCAEPLEWVAYGPCGHREVCSTCVVRLRFILDDRRCCICKTESSIVFVTKSMGDYTRTISDFSIFGTDATEGSVGEHWYHEDTQSFFDDPDHYKMVKAMCRLSCSVCDRLGEDQGNDGVKRRNRFRNIEQLKGHLFHKHKLFMCSLCLEGRKVFICEQKLYTRAQLKQHITSGDSEVDGGESERGGFMGHPMCEFCRNPFYGDNELYMHMSTEHYTCHICQRQHPGQYDYYKNYDDLEIHFRHEHFLCEDEACLAKKFIVFQTEAEMKRHNALEHGGHMSRSKRNAALQIPISFRYRRTNEQERRRARSGGGRNDASDYQLSMAIQASFETSNADTEVSGPSSNDQVPPVPEEPSDVHDATNSFELLAVSSEVEQPSRYLQAVRQSSRNARLEEASFPPLGPSTSTPVPSLGAEGLSGDTMAARLRQRNRGIVRVLNSSQSRSPFNHSSPSNYPPLGATTNPALVSSSSWTTQNQTSASSSSQIKPMADPGHLGSSSASLSWDPKKIAKGMSHSASAPNLLSSELSKSENSNLFKVQDVHSANKSLVERIRTGLGMDESKYTAFKEISAEFRQGQIGTFEYLAYVEQFGLSHLVLELARLCPDPQKQRELIEIYNANLSANISQENSRSNSHNVKDIKSTKVKGKSVDSGSASGKGKFMESNEEKGESVEVADGSRKEALVDNFLTSLRKLQESYKPMDDVEVLNKDGYRAGKAKLRSLNQAELGSSDKQLVDPDKRNESSFSGVKLSQNPADGPTSKQRKKMSKFHRVRLGDGSAAALLDLGRSDTSPERDEEASINKNTSDGLPVRGVWRHGGGQRLMAMKQRDTSK